MKKNDVTKLFLSNHRYYTSRYVFYKNKEFCVYNEEGWHVDFRNYPNIVSFITEGISFCYSYDKDANVWQIFLEEVTIRKGRIQKFVLLSFQGECFPLLLKEMDDELKSMVRRFGYKYIVGDKPT